MTYEQVPAPKRGFFNFRFFIGLCIALAVVIAAGAAMFHSDQKTARLDSPGGTVNGKPVADSTASD
jgi:hypothetical protein